MISLSLLWTWAAVIITLGIVYALIEKNVYSESVFTLLGSMIFLGATCIWSGHVIIGLLLFITGGTLLKRGLEGPVSNTEGASQKVWLITFKGQPTKVRVKSLTLTLAPLVGHIEFDTALVIDDLPFSKDLFCDGDKAYLEGKAAIAMEIDDSDIYDAHTGELVKSGGEQLMELANAGGMEGVKKQLSDILTTLVEKLYTSDPGYTSVWLEINGDDVSRGVYQACTESYLYRLPRNGPLAQVDIETPSGFGVKFRKFNIILQAPKEVREKRKQFAIEQADQWAELRETDTRSQQVRRRAASLGISTDLAHAQIMEEERQSAGQVQEVRGGQNVVALAGTTPTGNGGGTP